MSPLKLTIPGQYWDSQIYRGRLYLVDRRGRILTLDWDKLIENLGVENSLELATVCAFKRSDYLYRVAATGILHDEEFKTILNQRFARLAKTPLVVEKEQVTTSTLGEQDNPFPFPHTDSTVYNRRLYISSRSGVFSANCNGQTKYPVSTSVKMLWEAPVFALGASYGSLALAAGDAGLWEYALDDSFAESYDWETAPQSSLQNLTEQHCTDCQWAFYSIFGSSLKGPGVLAAYQKKAESDYVRRREFNRLIPDEEIFFGFEEPAGKYSWASQDKICQAADGSIRIAKYQPWKEDNPIESLGSLSLEHDGQALVSAKVALFGTVVELESSLVVLSSNGDRHAIAGEPISWRVFPRSRHYENHLHVIYEDRLDILSFNHDYLLDQQMKLSGFSGWFGGSRRSFDSLGLQ